MPVRVVVIVALFTCDASTKYASDGFLTVLALSAELSNTMKAVGESADVFLTVPVPRAELGNAVGGHRRK